MKKICLLLCCILMLQMLCACTPKKEDFQTPVNFYYVKWEFTYNSPAGVIAAEIREGADIQNDPQALLSGYLLGPETVQLRSLVPAKTQLVSCQILEDTAYVELSDEFAELTGVKLTMACAAMLMTLNDILDIQVLSVCAQNSLLDDKETVIMAMEDILLADMIKVEE